MIKEKESKQYTKWTTDVKMILQIKYLLPNHPFERVIPFDSANEIWESIVGTRRLGEQTTTCTHLVKTTAFATIDTSSLNARVLFSEILLQDSTLARRSSLHKERRSMAVWCWSHQCAVEFALRTSFLTAQKIYAFWTSKYKKSTAILSQIWDKRVFDIYRPRAFWEITLRHPTSALFFSPIWPAQAKHQQIH